MYALSCCNWTWYIRNGTTQKDLLGSVLVRRLVKAVDVFLFDFIGWVLIWILIHNLKIGSKHLDCHSPWQFPIQNSFTDESAPTSMKLIAKCNKKSYKIIFLFLASELSVAGNAHLYCYFDYTITYRTLKTICLHLTADWLKKTKQNNYSLITIYNVA